MTMTQKGRPPQKPAAPEEMLPARPMMKTLNSEEPMAADKISILRFVMIVPPRLIFIQRIQQPLCRATQPVVFLDPGYQLHTDGEALFAFEQR
jgi:hypothetical protein